MRADTYRNLKQNKLQNSGTIGTQKVEWCLEKLRVFKIEQFNHCLSGRTKLHCSVPGWFITSWQVAAVKLPVSPKTIGELASTASILRIKRSSVQTRNCTEQRFRIASNRFSHCRIWEDWKGEFWSTNQWERSKDTKTSCKPSQSETNKQLLQILPTIENFKSLDSINYSNTCCRSYYSKQIRRNTRNWFTNQSSSERTVWRVFSTTASTCPEEHFGDKDFCNRTNTFLTFRVFEPEKFFFENKFSTGLWKLQSTFQR